MGLGDDPELPGDDAELETMLRQIAAQPPANPARDNGPWDFLLRRADDEVAGRILPLVRRLFDDADPIVRRRAIDLSMNISADAPATVARLLEAARRPALYGGDEFEGATLRQRLTHALANRASGSGREREIAQALERLAGDDPPDDAAATVLAKFAPDFAERSTRRFAARPEAERFCIDVAATFAVYQRDRLVRTLAGLRALPAGAKQQILDGLAGDLALPAETIRKLTAKVGAPAPTTAPTLDECRRALGA
ncbi:MAG TPA: hypothetical protein VFF06_32790 [Polyangia bacterium]|nr:hypothetical protein [Polyangia bacterium]